MSFRKDGLMRCSGCGRDLPRERFSRGTGQGFSTRCAACRRKVSEAEHARAIAAPAAAPRGAVFRIGYGRLFPERVRLTGLAPVNYDTALLVGELYNANPR